MQEYTSGSSLRAEETPPKKYTSRKQMVDFRGFPLSTEEGNPLTTDKEAYPKSEYGADFSPSVVLNSESYLKEGISSGNQFSKKNPAALPVEEQFRETSEVSRSLLGIDRQAAQQGIFGNVSTYGLDEKDWKVDGSDNTISPEWWYLRPSSAGNYFMSNFEEDTTNSALVISAYPSPYTVPPKPEIQDLLLTDSAYTGWAQYVNSIVAQYIIEYMVKTFNNSQLSDFNLTYLLNRYPPKVLSDGSLEFNRLYWDKIWLDIAQSRFGSDSDYPIIPSGRAYNFVPNDTELLQFSNFRDPTLWGQNGDPRVIISSADAAVGNVVSCAWNSFFFSSTRTYYPYQTSDDKGHFRIKTNPTPEIWEKYFGLDWDYLRQDLKDWNFKIHQSTSTITSVETQLKLPYFLLNQPLVPNKTNLFSSTWPSVQFGSSINLPTDGNRIGGASGLSSQVTIKSIRSFRYQPGRISGFTYGSKASDIGAGPGTTIEWGIENKTDAYFFRLKDGADFTVVRRSTIPFEENNFFTEAGYISNTKKVIVGGIQQYETIVEQKNMNGDPLSGEGKSGYIINPDSVTMYKIEFGWYGAIGAKFYAYIPQENGECRWVCIHTFVIENQLDDPCLADPFFYFRYRLIVSDSSRIRLNQYLHKFGASYYIDGYDEGTLYSSSANSRTRLLNDPQFTTSKTYLNAIDWTVLMGVKPKRYLFNRFGKEIYNKKEIFPKSFSIFSQEDCEVKIIRQKACPEFAYTHQEGYTWNLLPESRRLKAKFSVNRYNSNDPDLGIDPDLEETHTATLALSSTISGWRDPSDPDNYDVIPLSGVEKIRVVGDDIFNTVLEQPTLNLGPNASFKLHKIKEDPYISSRQPISDSKVVHLPFTYAPAGEYADGYEVEFDYYRRDQILLSSVNVVSDEFFIFWTGGQRNGIDGYHASTMRVGFLWPSTAGNTSTNLIHKDRSPSTWGIETPALDYVSYDGEKFYEGLPVDFINDYSSNCLYVETVPETYVSPYGLETYESDNVYELWDLEDDRLNVPGAEGGICHALRCKAGLEVRDAIIISLQEKDTNGNEVTVYYLQDYTPWPDLGRSYSITVSQGGESANIPVSDPQSRRIGDVIVYLIEIGQNLPSQLNEGDAKASYNIIYIAEVDSQLDIRSILTSDIAPGSLPFIRPFIQARQGCSLGGVWVGQNTANGIVLDPFTPHRSTVNIKDSGAESHGESLDPVGSITDGAIKTILTVTEFDQYGRSTAPTDNFSQTSLDSNKSFHTNKRKCGSFLSYGGTNAAGILTPTDYPIRWLTGEESGLPLGTYYVSKNQSVEISLEDIFNVSAESIVNSDSANLATIFIARSLNSHSITGSTKEIYMTLNYDEQ